MDELRRRSRPRSRSVDTTCSAGSSTSTGQSRHSLWPRGQGPAAPGAVPESCRRPGMFVRPLPARGASSALALPAPSLFLAPYVPAGATFRAAIHILAPFS